jgi:hypothetical protein
VTDTSGTGARESAAPPDTAATPRYSERLYVTWYLWPLPLIAAVLLAAEIHMGYPGVRAWLPYVVIVPLVLLLIVRSGMTKVAVDSGELWVGDAHLPLEFVGAVETFHAKEKRRVLGPNLDPAAHLLHRGWVGPLVRVEVTDPADPTPYWVFSTRRPNELAALLRSGHA